MKTFKDFLTENKVLSEQTYSIKLSVSDIEKAEKLFDDINFVYKRNGEYILFKNQDEFKDAKEMLKIEKIKYKE